GGGGAGRGSAGARRAGAGGGGAQRRRPGRPRRERGCVAHPLAGRRLPGALEGLVDERGQRLRRIGALAYLLVGKHELAELVVPPRRSLDALGLRIAVGEERWVLGAVVARPEPRAEDLFVAPEPRDHVGPRRRADRTPRVEGHRKIERSPPELHRRRLPAEARTARTEDRFDVEQHAPER